NLHGPHPQLECSDTGTAMGMDRPLVLSAAPPVAPRGAGSNVLPVDCRWYRHRTGYLDHIGTLLYRSTPAGTATGRGCFLPGDEPSRHPGPDHAQRGTGIHHPGCVRKAPRKIVTSAILFAL